MTHDVYNINLPYRSFFYLKIEVRKDSEISQVYREISALHALGDLPCVPKILFEGYTMGGSLALLTDFAGQPLESWISDNGNIDDHTIFQIVLDLLSCYMPVVTRMEMWPYEALYREMVISILLISALQLCCNFSPIHVKQLFGTTSNCVKSLELSSLERKCHFQN